MRLIYFLAILLLLCPFIGAEAAPLINPIGGQPPDDAGPALARDASVDQVLDALDQRGKSLREFTAKVSITTGDPDVERVTTRSGNLWFQKIGEDDGRIHVIFNKKKEENVTTDEKIEYLLDDGWLTDRDYHKKAETRRQVLKPGDKINLLKLGEGPFPLPLGQKKEDVHAIFEVTEIPLEKDGPKELADTIHLQLKPRPGTGFARRFGAIDVWVSRTSHFPVKIRTINPDEGDPHVTRLEDVQVNPPGGIKDEDFKLPPIDEGAWSLHTEPYHE